MPTYRVSAMVHDNLLGARMIDYGSKENISEARKLARDFFNQRPEVFLCIVTYQDRNNKLHSLEITRTVTKKKSR